MLPPVRVFSWGSSTHQEHDLSTVAELTMFIPFYSLLTEQSKHGLIGWFLEASGQHISVVDDICRPMHNAFELSEAWPGQDCLPALHGHLLLVTTSRLFAERGES